MSGTTAGSIGSPVKTILAAGLFTPAHSLNGWKDAIGEHAEVLEKSVFAGSNHNSVHELAASVRGYLLGKYGPRTTIHFVGHSMMGLVAQLLAQDMSNLWATLIAPAPPRGVLLGGVRTLWPRMAWSGIAKGRLLKKTIVPSPADMQALMTNLVPKDQQGRYDVPHGEPAPWVWDIILAKVGVNSLGDKVRVITGQSDAMITHQTCLRIAKKHNCAVKTHNGGHLPWLEPVAPEVFDMVQDSWGDFWFLRK